MPVISDQSTFSEYVFTPLDSAKSRLNDAAEIITSIDCPSDFAGASTLQNIPRSIGDCIENIANIKSTINDEIYKWIIADRKSREIQFDILGKDAILEGDIEYILKTLNDMDETALQALYNDLMGGNGLRIYDQKDYDDIIFGTRR